MKKAMLLTTGLLLALIACSGSAPDQTGNEGNPFFAPYQTEFDVQPFDRILPEHYVPAFEEAMGRQNAEI